MLGVGRIDPWVNRATCPWIGQIAPKIWRIEPGRLQRRTRVDPLDPPRLGVVGKHRKRDQSRAAGGSDPRRPGRRPWAITLGDLDGFDPGDGRRALGDLGKFGLGGLGGFDLGDDPGEPRTDQHMSNPNPYWSCVT